jgi:hypothetical protein
MSGVQQNLGAMVRSAYFFGVDGVLASSKNCARLSAAACKASAGALEEVNLFDTDNLAHCLQSAADNGWQVHLRVISVPFLCLLVPRLRLLMSFVWLMPIPCLLLVVVLGLLLCFPVPHSLF